jgi:LmbE family N-acetylglucosaminyl deacetylase
LNSLFISSHNDDSELFGSYTLLREKPLVLVVTDSFVQYNRGDGITAEQRRNETIAATKILGCPVLFAGLRDDTLSEAKLRILFKDFSNFDKIYAPAIIENGNVQHNMIGKVAKEFWPDLIAYMTYSKTDLWKNGSVEIKPIQEEIDLKNKALNCYSSQINLPSTRPHFAAVRGRSEWYE